MLDKEIHEQLLSLLKEFKKVCQENNIWYSLAYGSVLGAVRHNGFIPWDLDADVFIILPERNKFRNAFSKYDHGDIILKNCETAERCVKSHDSLVYNDKNKYAHLDIYVLIGAASDQREQRKNAFFSYYLDRIFRSKYVDIKRCKPKNKLFVMGAKIITCVIPDRVIKQYIHKKEIEYPFNESEFLTNLGAYNRADICVPKGVMLDVIEHEFEGELFNIPKNYDEYLTRTYGKDYMIPKKY